MIEARAHLACPPGPAQARLLEVILQCVAEGNANWFRMHPDAPCCLKCAGVRYHLPPRRKNQTFWSAPEVLANKRATCAEAVTYCVGKAIAEGKDAWVALEPSGGNDYHAVAYVMRSDGVPERLDPTSELEGFKGGDGSLCCDLLRVGTSPRMSRTELAREGGRDRGKARQLTSLRPGLPFQRAVVPTIAGGGCHSGAHSCKRTTED